ncbi:MAG: hypothetical protein AAF756_23070 [Pseudomonadota bacterium]
MKTVESIATQLWNTGFDNFADDRGARKLAVVLVTVDVLLIVIHVLKYFFKDEFIALFGYWIYRNLTITNDMAIPEITNYLKFAVTVFLLIRIFGAVRQPVYLAWAFVYGLALIDDSMRVHEQLGSLFSEWLAGDTFLGLTVEGGEGFRAQDAGEMIVYALYGGCFAVVLGLGFLLSEPLHRTIGFSFALLLGGLVFFVAVFDIFDRFVAAVSQYAGRVLSTLEDGGEMIVVSLTVAFTVSVYRRFRVS